MNISNEDIAEIIVEVPEGHRHVRATVRLKDGTEFTLLEAAVSNLLRAFVTVKTHPLKSRVRLVTQKLDQKKPGFADWQLLEEDEEGEEG